MNRIAFTLAAALLGCSGTSFNETGTSSGGGAAGTPQAGAGGAAGAGGSAAGAGGSQTDAGGAGGLSGAAGAAGEAGAPSGGAGGAAGAAGAAGGGGTGPNPCDLCKVYPNGSSQCTSGNSSEPYYWEHCPTECTPTQPGKTCELRSTYGSCAGFPAGCKYWCCK